MNYLVWVERLGDQSTLPRVVRAADEIAACEIAERHACSSNDDPWAELDEFFAYKVREYHAP